MIGISTAVNKHEFQARYDATLRSLEQSKRVHREELKKIYRDMSKVSIAANGIDPQLDELLKDLRRDIGNHADVPVIHARVARISQHLLLMEEQQDTQQANLRRQLKQLALPLETLPLPRKFKRKIRAYQQSCDTASADTLLKVIAEFDEIFRPACEQVTQKLAHLNGDSASHWWQRWFKPISLQAKNTGETAVSRENIPTVGISEPDDTLEKVEHPVTNTHELEASNLPESKPDSVSLAPPCNPAGGEQTIAAECVSTSTPALPTIGIDEPTDSTNYLSHSPLQIAPNEINHLLMKLLQQLKLPASHQAQMGEIQAALQQQLSYQRLAEILDHIIVLVSLVLNNEKGKHEEFLNRLKERLEEVHQFLNDLKQHEQTGAEHVDAFDTAIQTDVESMRLELAHANDLEALQTVVNIHLDSILSRVGAYREVESARMQSALTQLDEMTQRLSETEATTRRLQTTLIKERNKAQTDSLTSLANRLGYEQYLMTVFARWQRETKPLTIIVSDVDFFKSINDTHGHAAGDAVLRTIGQLYQNNTRKDDFAARFGGEEFVVVLTDTDLEGGIILAEKLREIIAAWPFVYAEEKMQITMSFGVAQFKSGDTVESAFERADRALYDAKQQGRNQVRSLMA